jgi:hypothetical protein
LWEAGRRCERRPPRWRDGGCGSMDREGAVAARWCGPCGRDDQGRAGVGPWGRQTRGSGWKGGRNFFSSSFFLVVENLVLFL